MAIAPEQTGIGIHRQFTTAGQDPYDTVAWEQRDARISHYATGAVAFEQRGVEVPASWSLNATNILAQKYFRGTLGTPEREWSLRQVADRVVDTITGWGRRGGYFADEGEAQAFSDELKYLIIHQRAAFNSPVWFNIGVQGVPQQASACQPYHSLVNTPEGLVPIGRLVETAAIGAKVYDAHGVTSIVAVKANGRKRVLRLHTKAGLTLDVTGDHLVWKRRGPGTGDFVPASHLKPNDQVSWHRTESWGVGDISSLAMAEAALAGWLQSDGFVGQYQGTNRSLTIEAMTVTPQELAWVSDALDRVFPGVHRHERRVKTQDQTLDCRRTRLYGNVLGQFVDRWDLRTRGEDMTIPPPMMHAPLPVVRCYLRSLFQAEGYVSIRERSATVGLAMISEGIVRGAQHLLARFGVFSRLRYTPDRRADRKACWTLAIRNAADRRRFADEIGFVDAIKAEKLERTFDMPGRGDNDVKALEIASIEQIGEDFVYDIQTESGEYLSGNLRVHNCFILAVEDSMDSILEWYKEEGIIFKGGSGAGVNLSRIRSSREHLRGGGTASGPVSFMRGADASAGTIKSGGKTRRAAKMVILDVDHPDVEDFIWCKAAEERKARALRDAGFDMDLDGRDSHSIQYQNANNSVRVTDAFMEAVIDDADWELTAVTTGDVVETVRARDLFRQMAKAAWECADPGMQFDTTINRWHTAPAHGRITASNPCSEYMHVDNSACNLASLNLLTFIDEDEGTFDVDGFKAATATVFTAQEILVGNADYPTEAIAENSRRFRQLGIGYANLGALLMSQGLAYDSDGGRSWAGAITSLLTGHAYATSARTAARMGPFAGFTENRDAMLGVLRMHRDAASQIDEDLVPPELLSAAQRAWDDAVDAAEEYGVRNAQSSVLAPTGTIALLMDCDTTGVEPDLSLVKLKKLVGGGTMSIVNHTVPRALRHLGYQTDQIDEIIAYIDEHKSILGAPHVAPEHLEVFACSMGDNTIHYRGHVRMMGAVQPFISGAISKTVNLPEEATVEDVEQLHIEAWELGLKAVAIYRDNCKVAQPLATAKRTVADPSASEAEVHDAELAVKVAALEDALARQTTVVVKEPIRERMPRRRRSSTFAFRVADCEGFVTVGEYTDGRPGEVFMKVAKQGSTLAGIMDAFAISVSLGLQHGVPLATYVKKYTSMRFEPAGMTDDPDLRIAQSLVDYIFRRLAVDYLPYAERLELGVLTSAERTQPTLPGIDESAPNRSIVETVTEHDQLEVGPVTPAVRDAAPGVGPVTGAGPAVAPANAVVPEAGDAPYCYQCGVQMQRAGSCHACPSCGTTSGCS